MWGLVWILILEFSFHAFKLINGLHFRFDDSSDLSENAELEAAANILASSLDFCPHPLIAFAT